MADQPNKKTCCEMRRKIVVGIYRVLTEAECGVSDAVMADYHDFDYQSKAGVPVAAALKFRFCPWCGTKRDDSHEKRTTEVLQHRPPSPEDNEGEEWKKGSESGGIV